MPSNSEFLKDVDPGPTGAGKIFSRSREPIDETLAERGLPSLRKKMNILRGAVQVVLWLIELISSVS